MAGEEEYGLPQRHPRPKGRYDTLSLFSLLSSQNFIRLKKLKGTSNNSGSTRDGN